MMYWGNHMGTGDSADEILDRRLASGELRIDQYRELRAVLDDASRTAEAQPSREPAGVGS